MAGQERQSTAVLGPNFDEAIRRLAEETQAQAIVLMGYFTVGLSPTADSVDLLVVVPGTDRKELYSRVALAWHDIAKELGQVPYDALLVYTPKEFVDNLIVGFGAHRAARDGVVLYGALPEEARSAMALWFGG